MFILCFTNLTDLYIFLISVWNAVLCIDQQITILINLFILFFTFAKISFQLHPEAIGSEASKTSLHGALIEFPFHTALHGIKFCISLLLNFSYCSGFRFLA